MSMAAMIKAARQRHANPREQMPRSQLKRLSRNRCQCRVTYVTGRPETIKCLSCIARERLRSSNPCANCGPSCCEACRMAKNQMSRKDYIAFSDALRGSDSRCADAVADVLAADNSRFDRGRFLEAASNPPRRHSAVAFSKADGRHGTGFVSQISGRGNLKEYLVIPDDPSMSPLWVTDGYGDMLSVQKRRTSSNPELLTVGLNPQEDRKVSHCIKVKSHKRCYKKGGSRKRSRGTRRAGRKGRRGGKRSWRAFVRKHKGMIKGGRSGVKRAMRKISKMYHRLNG